MDTTHQNTLSALNARRPMQGVANIVRFNWHFFVGSVVLIVALLLLAQWTAKGSLQMLLYLTAALTVASTLVALTVSYYVYDVSDLYRFVWLDDNDAAQHIVNIHAGFDETSALLASKYPKAHLTVLDFYDPERHTEISIRRARRAYPPYPNTQPTETHQLPLATQSVDKIFVILAAHEIRDAAERTIFFDELRRLLIPNGQITVIEHLRDTANFLAYNIGFFHFLTQKSWFQTFEQTHLRLSKTLNITPFVTVFILEKNDIPT